MDLEQGVLMNQDGQILQDSQGKPKRVVLGEDGRTIFGDISFSQFFIFIVILKHRKPTELLSNWPIISVFFTRPDGKSAGKPRRNSSFWPWPR